MQLKRYAEIIVFLACCLIVSAVWLFFSIAALAFGFTTLKAVIFAFSVASTMALFYAVSYMDLKGDIKELQHESLEVLPEIEQEIK
jgi:hypothetical protein